MKFGIQSVYGTVFTLSESEQIEEDSINYSDFEAGCSFISGSDSGNATPLRKVDSEKADRDFILENSVTPTTTKRYISALKRLFDSI